MSTLTFGKYQLVKKLATGGMAEVWLAVQTGIEGFNRHVVVKRILPHLAEEPEFVQMFLNEAKIASRFNHPNIAQIYDLGAERGAYYIAMEFIHGEDLGRVMRRAWQSGQWVARGVALRIVADTCLGLHYAHGRSDEQGRPLRVVHRDISPQNILVSFDGAVKLVDFGIAKAADQVSNTRSGAIKGKFAYMAPEQAAGKPLDARTDLFALGLVLYELVTGVRPLKRETELATLQAAMEGQIDPPSHAAEVPAEIDQLVMRALARSPDDRYPDAREFHRAIERFLTEQGQAPASSLQVAELMETLFSDRLQEERRSGAPAPATESSSSNPAAGPASTFKHLEGVPAATLDGDEPSLAEPGPVGPSRRYARASVVEEAQDGDADDGPTLRPEPPPRRPARPPVAQGGEGLGAAAPAVARRRTGLSSAMPEAPPRRASSLAALDEATARPSLGTLAGVDEVEAARARAGGRQRTLVGVLALTGAAVLLGVFREPLLQRVLGSSEPEGVPVRLTVTTNPRTLVTVVPAPGGPAGRAPLELGWTPLLEQGGARVGDTVVLANRDLGIRWEERVEVLPANAVKTIGRTFKEVTLRVLTRPRLRSADIFLGAQRLGTVGVPLGLYGGSYHLEVRSEQLTAPVPFDLVLGEAPSAERVVDVSGALERTPPAGREPPP
jgi:serine/threonine protein kinase